MTSSPRPALGRGLSALIPASGETPVGVEMVDIDLILPNPEQPRRHFDEQRLDDLAASIREHGVLQPVIVTRVAADVGPNIFQLVAGERRLQAARRAGETRMPVLIKEVADRDLLVLALVENIQRQDLNPIEEAHAFRRLHDEFGLKQEEMASRIGRSRVAISNMTRLLTLDPDIQMSLASGQIGEGHARALLSVTDAGVRLDMWRRIVSDNLTVRQAEEIAKALRSTSSTKTGLPDRRKRRQLDATVRTIEDQLRRALGARVAVARTKNGGRIVITFHNDEELEGIVDKIVS